MKNVLKSLLILVIIISFPGCVEKKKSATFKSVDCTIYYGYLKSIKVLGNGQAYIRFDKNSYFDKNLTEKSELYSVILEKNQMDSISKMAQTLLSNGIDSVYESTGNKGVTISIIISSNDNKSPSSQNKEIVKDYKPLYRLVNFLDEVSQKVKLTMDTTFVFKSRKFSANFAK